MSRIALVEGGRVTNVVVGGLTEYPGGVVLQPGQAVSPGDAYVSGEFSPSSSVPAVQQTQLAFLRRFTSEERIAIRASTDPLVQDFLSLLALAQDVRLDDPDTIAGVGYLEGLGLLAPGRGSAILGSV